MLQFVNEWQLHAVAFKLDGHAHLPAGISPRNVLAPATHPACRIAGPCFSDCGLRLLGQRQALTPEEKVGFVEQRVTSRPPERPLLSASRAPLVLQRQCVPPAGFSHQLLKIAAVLDGLFHVLGQLVRDVDGKASLPAAPIQRVTGMPLPRFAKLAAFSNARALPQRDGTDGNGPEIADCGLKPEFHLFRGFSACHCTGAY